MAKNKKAKHARLASRAASNRGSFKNSSRAQAHAHGRTTSSSAPHRRAAAPQHEHKAKPRKAHSQPSQSAAFIPFTQTGRSDILLVGEGDFSFAQSLAVQHRGRWRRLVATSYESRDACLGKYARAEKAVGDVIAQHVGEDGERRADVLFGIDATKLASYKELRNGKFVAKKKSKSVDKTSTAAGQRGATGGNTAPLGLRQGAADERQDGGWDWIVFNFPHVGGLSTDQRRQVRANQEMLVGFFESAAEILRRPGAARRSAQVEAGQTSEQRGDNKATGDPERYNTDDEEDDKKQDTDTDRYNTDDEASSPSSIDSTSHQSNATQHISDLDNQDIKAGGRILLTLFDGLPYTLWNVRDLARHAGLAVERSFKFQASAYPGYEHARTLGDLRSKPAASGTQEDDEAVASLDDDEDDDDDTEDSAEREARVAAGLDRDEAKREVAKAVGPDVADGAAKRPGAWRGEERPARSYIFALAASVADQHKTKRKRAADESDDESD